ncbi:MAG TPA: hypothetical protein VLY87_04290 [Flavobacterium sp.]|nr:hypothetical protein [Flavobacterium sp.]
MKTTNVTIIKTMLKNKILTLLFCNICSLISFSQERELITIGVLKDSQPFFAKDKNLYIQKINDSLFSTPNYIKDLLIKKNTTIGDITEPYYYIQFISDDNVFNRLLLCNNDYLYIVNENQEEFTVYDFYFGCVGDGENCSPKLFKVNEKYAWSCGDALICEPNGDCASKVTIF